MKLFIMISLLTASSALADTTKFVVKGMHCGSCEKNVKKAVCRNEEMKSWFEKCDAKVTDEKSETGELILETKKGISLDADKQNKIESALKEVGKTLERAQ